MIAETMSGGAGDEEDRIGAENLAGLARVGERALQQPDAPATSVGIANFHTTGITEGLVD